LRALFRLLIRGDGLFADRLAVARQSFAGDPHCDQLFDFVDSAGRNGICQSFKR